MADNPTARDRYRAIADRVRGLAERHGMRPITVTVRTRLYSGSVGAVATTLLSTTDVVLSPIPKVRVPRARDSDQGFVDGPYTDATGQPRTLRYLIGPITPSHGAGGYDPSALAGDDAVNRRVTVVLGGEGFDAGGEEYAVTNVDTTHALRVMLTVERTRQGA